MTSVFFPGLLPGNTQICKVITKAGTPGSSDYNYDIGTLCVDTTNDLPYVLCDKASGTATWKTTTGSTTLAALTDTNISSASTGQLLIYDGTDSWDNKSVSGDISINASGVVAITTGCIINTDIKSDAAIAFSKLAALTTGSVLIGVANVATALDIKGDGKILVGNGTTATSVAVSGDCTLANDGSMTVTDLTIASEARGDVLYRGASAWSRLVAGTSGYVLTTKGAGADPEWAVPTISSATTLANGCFLNDAGANDAVLSFTTQTVSAPTLTVPDFAGASDTFAFVTLAQTLTNKTLTSPTLTTPVIVTTGSITDAGGDPYVKFVEATTPKTYIQITSGDTGVSPMVEGAGETNTNLMLKGSGTGNVQITDGGDITAKVEFELDGATTGKTLTLACSQDNDYTITMPNATTTLVGTDFAQTLSSKTLTAPKIATTDGIADAGGDFYLKFVEATTPKTYVQINSGDTTVSPIIEAAGETNLGLMLKGAGTGNVQITDGGDTTCKVEFELDGATTGKTLTLTCSHDNDYTITMPNATTTLVGTDFAQTLSSKTLTSPILGTSAVFDQSTEDYTLTWADPAAARALSWDDPLGDDKFVFRDEAVTLTNKTIDCASNTVSNANLEELEVGTIPAADGNYDTVVDGLMVVKLNNHNGWVDVVAPVNCIIADAWSVNMSADGGSWKINSAAAGAGTDITDSVTVAASDKDIDRPTQIDDSVWEIAASGTFSVYGEATLDAMVFIRIIPLT